MADDPANPEANAPAHPKRISLGQATMKGMTEDLRQTKDMLKESYEQLGEARRQLHLLRQKTRKQGWHLRVMYVVCFLFIVCVIGQLFMVEYLMR